MEASFAEESSFLYGLSNPVRPDNVLDIAAGTGELEAIDAHVLVIFHDEMSDFVVVLRIFNNAHSKRSDFLQV
jgi:hypothetical protein